METSPEINKLADALAKAQSEFKPAKLDMENPFFKSKYASLASVWESCRNPLTKNNLSVAQIVDNGDDLTARITTILMHNSGQWIKGELSLKPVKNDPQGWGSVISYSRRYSLCGILGISSHAEDDDAEFSMGRKKQQPSKTFIESINKQRDRVGEEVFMKELGLAGYETVDEIKTRDKQITFYNKLKTLPPAQKDEPAQPVQKTEDELL